MIITTPDARLAFSMMRPASEISSRTVPSQTAAEVVAPRIVRRAIAVGLAGASILLVALAG